MTLKNPVTATVTYIATASFSYGWTAFDTVDRVGRGHVRAMKEAAAMALELSLKADGAAVTLQGHDDYGRATTPAIYVEAAEYADDPDYPARIVTALQAGHYVETFRAIMPAPLGSIYTYWSC